MVTHYTREVLGEAGEGGFDCQTEHASRELVDDAAAVIFDLLTYQRLVGCGLRLEFA